VFIGSDGVCSWAAMRGKSGSVTLDSNSCITNGRTVRDSIGKGVGDTDAGCERLDAKV
jgi:hypothetical protein